MILIISIAAGILLLAGLIVFLVFHTRKKKRMEKEKRLKQMQELDDAISNSDKPDIHTIGKMES